MLLILSPRSNSAEIAESLHNVPLTIDFLWPNYLKSYYRDIFKYIGKLDILFEEGVFLMKNNLLNQLITIIAVIGFMCLGPDIQSASEETKQYIANAAQNQAQADELKPQERLAKILGDEYPTFVEELGENIKDPKFLAVLKAGDKLIDKISFKHNISYPCSQLIPTQNEIDVEKSLSYPLKIDPYGNNAGGIGIIQYLQGGVFAPGGPIVTAGGKYIVDGHHRWSQLYLINPNAEIKALNLNIADPIKALKVTQLAIASIISMVPASLVEGKNLITMQEADFRKWIMENITQDAVDAFKQGGIDGIEAIITHIWKNAQQMKQYNAPIENAPNRGLMPQTGGDVKKGVPVPLKWEENLESGVININPPY